MKRFFDKGEFSHLYVDDNFGARRIYEIPVGYASDPEYDHHFQRIWFVGSGILNSGQSAFVIPVAGLEQMSDEDILSAIKGTISVARIARLEKQIIDNDGRPEMLTGAFSYTLEDFRDINETEYSQLGALAYRSSIVADGYKLARTYWEGRNDAAGFIYILADQQGHFKIGRTTQLTTRIKQLGTQPPFRILLVCAFRVVDAVFYEHELHEEFAAKRMNGEWFALDDADLEKILASHAGQEFLTERDLEKLEAPNARPLLKGNSYDY